MRQRSFLALAILASSFTAAYAEDGLALYNTNCSVCHQSGGIGSPGQFPPLNGRVGKIAATPEGKAYLADVVLNGLHGSITAAGGSYSGFMPALKTLSNDQIATILTHVSSLGVPNAPSFTAAEIEKARSTPKKSKELIAERKALDAAHPLP